MYPITSDHNIQSTAQDMTQVLHVDEHLCRVMDSDGYSLTNRYSSMCPPTPILDQCSTSSDIIS
ncbi:hypothetical protein HKD37_17G046962 [Glycine soja]